jgi:hypothetical protein
MQRQAMIGLATSAEADVLAARIAQLADSHLSNPLFQAILIRMSEVQRAAWINQLPTDRAAWARAAMR